MKRIGEKKYIFKIASNKILRSKKNLKISIASANKNLELIGITNSNLLNYIDFLNNINTQEGDKKIKLLKEEKKMLQKSFKNNNTINKNRIKKIYDEIENLNFKKDILFVEFSKKSDFKRLKKFIVNEITFVRLLGTPNQLKNKTVCYINKEIYSKIEEFLNCGRDMNYMINPSKLEAYRALSLSGIDTLSYPKKILVVKDLEVKFNDDVITLDSTDLTSEPKRKEENVEIVNNVSDGFGIATPELMERWSKELGLNYTMAGGCLRNAYLKGMVFAFDKQAFKDKYASDKDFVIDVWGNEINVNEVELILTTSMLKLWDAYKSIDDYINNCKKFNYSFGITKPTPKKLDEETTLNYQFIQSYDLTDDEIHQLIKNTIDDFHNIQSDDHLRLIEFFTGIKKENITYEKLKKQENFIKALYLNPELIKDSYVIQKTKSVLINKKTLAKIGKVKVRGNYSVVSGDPFALMQSIFNLVEKDEDYGLLKRDEIYNKFWVDKSAKEVVCFRAPMSCHNNIQKRIVANDADMEYWYQHTPTITIISCHDNLAMAANGLDKDGDLMMTTDEPVLVKNTKNLSAINCLQKKADKKIPSKKDLEVSNYLGMDCNVGTVTNKITNMYDVISRYPSNSNENRVLRYRIVCGQQYQQDTIDSLKGVVCSPMPKYWYSIKDCYKYIEENNFSEEEKQVLLNCVASKKPYFMRFIYPKLDKEYKNFIEKVKNKSLLLFNMNLEDLLNIPLDKDDIQFEEKQNFIKYYYKLIPLSKEKSVMNRLCFIVEEELEKLKIKLNQQEFDYSVLKSINNYPINKNVKTQIVNLSKTWINLYKTSFMKNKQENENVSNHKNIEFFMRIKENLSEIFFKEGIEICTNEEYLCDILIDVFYKNKSYKNILWLACGDIIVKNLEEKFLKEDD